MAKLITADGVKISIATAMDGARHVTDQTELGALKAAGLIARRPHRSRSASSTSLR